MRKEDTSIDSNRKYDNNTIMKPIKKHKKEGMNINDLLFLSF